MEKLNKPQIICHVEKVLDYTIHDVKWIPSSAKFVALGGKSNGAGVVEVYELNSEGVEKVGEFGKKEHFKCGTFDASSLRNRHLATGDFCGRLQVWPRKKLILFQFPERLPSGALPDHGDGFLGKLLVRQSGAREAVFGDVRFNVDRIAVKTENDAVAVADKQFTELGAIECIYVISPNISDELDLEDNLIPVYKTTKHKGIINAIDGVAGTSVGCGAPEIATGSKDGTVMLWDVRQKDDPVATFRAANDSSARDCWCLAFGNSYNSEERVIAAGYDNGDIKMYDLRTMKVLWSKCVKNGVNIEQSPVVSLQFDRKDIKMNKLVATTLESKIVCFDVRTLHPTRGFAQATEKAHDSTVWQVKHLPQNREIFMTTGGSGSMCLWKYVYPDERIDKDGDGLPFGVIGELHLVQNSTLSGQPLSSFDWCKDKLGLAVCSSFDQTVRVLISTKLNLI